MEAEPRELLGDPHESNQDRKPQ